MRYRRFLPIVSFAIALLLSIVPYAQLLAQLTPNNRTEIVANVEAIARQTTVRIDSSEHGNGSGAIVAKEGNTYYVLTADHVVQNPDRYEIVTPDERRYPIDNSTIATFAGVDIALLQFTSQKTYSVATLANYHIGLDRTPLVFLSGFPAGKSNGEPKRKLTPGRLFPRSLALSIVQESYSLTNGYGLVYTNLSQAGMSGGTVLDSLGRVVGINAAVEATLEINNAGRIEELQLGRSLGVPISTFLGLVSQTKLNPASLKVESSLPKTLSDEDISAIENSLFKESEPSQQANAFAWLNYGNQLWRVNRMQEAVAACDRAIQIQPNLYQAYAVKGLALYTGGQATDALAAVDRSLEIEPNFYKAWRLRSLILEQLGKYQEALESIDRAIAIQPDDAVLYLGRGDILLEIQQYQDAIASYTSALKLRQSYEGYLWRGMSRLSSTDYRGAVTDLTQAIAIDPNESAGYLLRASVYLSLLELQAAVDDLDRASELAPNDSLLNFAIYPARGIARASLGDYQNAIADCNKSLEDKSALAVAAAPIGYSCRAFAYFSWGDYPQAIADAEKATGNQLAAGSAYGVRGLTYISMGEFPKAIADFDRVINENMSSDGNYSAYIGRSMAYAYSGDLKKAIADANKAIEIQPNNSASYFNRGFCHILANNVAGAIADADKAIELQPKFPEYYALRGAARMRQGDVKAGLADLDEGFAQRDNSAIVISTKAAILYEQGNRQEAIALWQKATELNKDPKYQLALAAALYANGDRDRGLAIAKNAFALNQNLAYPERFRDLFWGDRLLSDVDQLLELFPKRN